MRIDVSTIVDSHYPLLLNYARFSHTHSMQKSHLSYLIATDVANRVGKKISEFFFFLVKIKIFRMKTLANLSLLELVKNLV